MGNQAMNLTNIILFDSDNYTEEVKWEQVAGSGYVEGLQAYCKVEEAVSLWL